MNPFKVAILQRRLTHYRLPFFEALREELRTRKIELVLVYGQPAPTEIAKKDEGHLRWAVEVHNGYWRIFGKDLVWQPLPKVAADADLLVFTQENSILSNYAHLLKRRLGGPKVAYWGHGVNFQSAAPGGLRERWKRLWLSQVDWWFAYTELTMQHLRRAGFPRARITCLNNAVDTQGFKRELAAVTDAEVMRLRETYAIKPDASVGLFCGSLYPDKRLDLLLSAAELVHKQRPDFVLAIMGDGPSAPWLRTRAENLPWIKILGPLRGEPKAAWFRLADISLNPGAAGLIVLDSFAAGLPMITIASARHGPEIAYLSHGENALIVGDNPQTYAEAVLSLLCDMEERKRLGANALAASAQYTVENMTRNFAEGVSLCVASHH